MTDVTPHCPHCGSEYFVTRDMIYAYASIDSWYIDDDGLLCPEFTGDTDVDWNSQRARDTDRPYECVECGRSVAENEMKLVPKESVDE